MNRDDALRIVAGSRDGESGRAQSPTPDSRSSREQIFALERGRFEERLAKAALAREKSSGSWPEPPWFARHRRLFATELARSEEPKFRDPPCKHWKDRVKDDEYVSMLETIWNSRIADWARRYMYLASPSAPCECDSCRPKSVYAGVDWSEPMRTSP